MNPKLELGINVFVFRYKVFVWKKDLHEEKYNAKGDNDEVFIKLLFVNPTNSW
jgi:hypothetical protein